MTYTHKCYDCGRFFKTNKPKQKACDNCLSYRKPHNSNKTKKKKHVLTFAEILHIAEVYNKIHHKYLHYGDVVSLISLNPNKCVCCGASVLLGTYLCSQCEGV